MIQELKYCFSKFYKVRAAGDGWAEGQGAVSQISVHLHKDNQAPRPTASQYR